MDVGGVLRIPGKVLVVNRKGPIGEDIVKAIRVSGLASHVRNIISTNRIGS